MEEGSGPVPYLAMTWWQDAVGYEVYIRSFADGDGDGTGDLEGLTERLDHLAWLGVDVVWVTPFYPSPQADFGYDVADYTGVDQVYGNLEAFDRLVARADELGLKLMIDIVPNHSSSQHEWFRRALADPEGPYRDYYLFRPPGPDGGPPNNWVSNFGGPAWTLDPLSGEYYCHLFLPEQPDLDWTNEDVRREFDGIFEFWLERGVAGFRIDVAHALMKHPSFADNPVLADVPIDAGPAESFYSFDHLYDQDQDSTKEIYRRWKTLPGSAEVAFVGEVYVQDVQRSASYMGGGGLDLSLFFGLNRRPWHPRAFAAEIREWVDASPGGFAWTIASHDEHRPPTRFGGGDLGRSRTLALWTTFAILPGMPFVYQGEELGLENGTVQPTDVQDPIGLVAYDECRDFCRTPMPWEPGPHGGFTTADEAWIRSAPRRDDETVAVQRADADSHLHLFRRLLDTRRATAADRREPVEWIDAPGGVVAFRRGTVIVVSNLTDGEIHLDVDPSGWKVLFDSSRSDGTAAPSLRLPPRTGRIYRT